MAALIKTGGGASHRVELTTHGHRPHLKAVADAFGGEVAYAQLVEIYGEGPKTEVRYSPPNAWDAHSGQ